MKVTIAYAPPGATTRHTRFPGDALSLTDELRALEGEYPGWHCWPSDTGVVHAATCRCPLGGCGTTLEAPTPQAMRQVIAEQMHLWALGVIAA